LFLKKLEVYPGLPSQTVTIDKKKVRLDDEIYRQYAVDVGHKVKSWLDKKVQLEVWQGWLETELGRERLKSKIDSKFKEERERALSRAKREQKKRMEE